METSVWFRVDRRFVPMDRQDLLVSLMKTARMRFAHLKTQDLAVLDSVPVTVILVLVVMEVLFATPPKNMQALKALQ
jgi:hypothetical protein